MTKQELRKALEALRNEAVRDCVAVGDFSSLDELSLDDQDREFLRGAAEKPPFGLAGHRFLRDWTVTAGRPRFDSGATGVSSEEPSQRRSGSPPRHPVHFNAVAAVADEAALRAFDRLRDALAADGSPHGVARQTFVRGKEVACAQLVDLLGVEGVEAFLRVGALASADGASGRLRPGFGVFVAGRLMVLIPPQVKDQGDFTYFGGDSIGLLERAWSLATGGRLAIELGTGTGFLAAALAPRYELVIATELLRSSASVATLTFRLNSNPSREGRGRLALCIADVAGGLLPGCADFVISNPPFMPAPPRDSAGRAMTHLDGGPTGLELPTRFILEGARLLARGGISITRCLDITLDDGKHPLVDLCTDLRKQGFTTSIEPVRAAAEFTETTEEIPASRLTLTAMLSDVVIERSTV